jgi:hypothetical protein
MDRLSGLRVQQIVVLSKLSGKKRDARNDANISEYGNRLPEVDLLHALHPPQLFDLN